MIVCEEFEAEDKQLKLAQQTADMQAVTAGLLTDNEWRTKYGYPPADDGDARRQPTQPQADPFGGMFGGAGSGDTTQQPKAVTTKAVPRPTIKQFIQVLQGVFGQQAKRVLGEMKSVRKAIPNGTWYDLDADLSAMASQLQPIVEAFFDQASGQLVQRLGFNDAVPKVVNASIPEAARSAVLAFCQATNDTTSQELDSALAATRKALEDGLSQGEAANQLTRRVQQIFENLQTDRAYRIAVTEQSRAQHTSELLTLNAAGVDAKKVWLDTELNACDECKALHGKTVGLNENFVTKGTGAYSEISAPPLHCHCRCSLDYVVDGS
jgi:SPP1 gp7 family putative phage head morphogenesis protein